VTLFSQAQIEESSTGWRGRMFEQLEQRLGSHSSFPCFFLKNAFKKGLLLFSFIEEFTPAELSQGGRDLMAYVSLCKTWNGSLSTAHPLVMAFSPATVSSKIVSDYHAIAWRVLQFWHDFDPEPWPENVAKDPQSAFWSMCYGGMQLFVNVSCPAHLSRKSRNLGDYMLLVINPRERFDIVAGDTPSGRQVRAQIRQRIHRHDGIPHCHQLGSYQAGAIEWWQYGIIEENADRLDTCPFKNRS
jgi:N-omega-hydroxy-L-arginine synthase